MSKILVVDDNEKVRKSMREILEYEKYEVEEAVDGQDGLNKLKNNRYDLVFLDLKMPKVDGLEVFERGVHLHPETPYVIITGHGDVETAVKAVKMGAFDFIEKPLDLSRILITVRNALDRSDLVTQTKALKRKITKTREIIGESPAITHIKETINRVAPTDARVLVTGENGTGKELVARWIHERSNRADGHFVEVNCAAIPSELIESELFGHEKGAFTSAIKQRIGKFEQANSGTLFLDEIGDMSLSAQAKVLRALQENKITRVGGDKDLQVDVRVVAATNKDLVKEIKANRFRMDLYHRLSVILLHVPSLNERKEDIPLLAERFSKEACEEHGLPQKTITPKAIKALQNIHWTGNIRELHNVIERLVILSQSEKVTEDDVFENVPPRISGDSNIELFERFSSYNEYRDYMEKKFIEYMLAKYDWNISKASEAMDVPRSHLYNKIEKYELKKEVED